MLFLYNLGIYIYRILIGLAAIFNPKARLWVSGRVDLFEKISNFRVSNEGKLVWIHCASLGEFEQGRPVIESLKKQRPDWKIMVTFYSPSGYEIRKNYEAADAVFYLPLDTKDNAQKFVKSLRPDVAIFVKYEFWYHHLRTLATHDIPTILISSVFRKNQIFFRSYGSLHRQILSFFTKIFVQDRLSFENLQSIDIQHIELSGDTRIDRVLSIAKAQKKIEKATIFKEKNKILICGSTWEADENIIAEVISAPAFLGWKFIIAPHEIDEAHLLSIEKKMPLPTIRFSKINTENAAENRILLIDNIGLLSALYSYGDLAYIGGGFGAGIHNTLEPMAHGLPVIFGPKYHKFGEAVYLTKSKGGFAIENAGDLREIFLSLSDGNQRDKAAKSAKQYILENQGASEGVVQWIL